MLDTITLALYGIDAKFKSANALEEHASLLASYNKNYLDYLVPEHQALYMALIGYKGILKSYDVVEKNQVYSADTMTDDEFLRNQAHHRTASKKNVLGHLHLYEFNTLNMVKGFTHKKITLSERIGIRLLSSNRDVNFFVNVNKGCIKVEFSIPKFLYNHNIAQFIPQANSHKYTDRLKLNKWDYQVSIIYERLLKFIDEFFTELCQILGLEMLPNFEYVAIERLDLCYNQIYRSKEDALHTLSKMQKLASKVKNKLSLSTSIYGNTGIHYKMSSGATFKIYHKGSEFKINDAKDLNKINHLNISNIMRKSKYYKFFKKHKDIILAEFDKNEIAPSKKIEVNPLVLEKYDNYKYMFSKPNNYRGTWSDQKAVDVFDEARLNSRFSRIADLKDKDKILIKKIRQYIKMMNIANIKFLQAEADKILRFEITFRPDFIRYHYKDRIFRKNDKVHKIHKAIFKKVKSAYDLRNRDFEAIQKISIYEKRFYKRYDAWRNKKLNFWLKGSRVFQKHEKTSCNSYDKDTGHYDIRSYAKKHDIVLSDFNNAIFSEDLLELLFSYFRTQINRYQIKDLTFEEDLSKRIDLFNEEAKKNRIAYDMMPSNEAKIKDRFGKYLYKHKRTYKNPEGVFLTRPSDLLTQNDLFKKHLAGVNKFKILSAYEYLKKGKSLDNYRKDYKISSSNFSRLKKHLEQFNIYHNTFFGSKQIFVNTDFTDYYSKFDTYDYASKFYVDKHLIQNHNEND